MIGKVVGVEEAEEAFGAEDSESVAFFNKVIAGSAQDVITLTTCPRVQTVLATDQKKRLNNNKPKPITLHGKDSSKLPQYPMTTRRLKGCGAVLLQSSMETIETGSRCSLATSTMSNITVVNISRHSWA